MSTVSKKYSIIYLRPAKTGGGVVELSLGGYKPNDTSNIIRPCGCHGPLKRSVMNQFPDYHKIITIRNTYSLAVSMYRWSMKNRYGIIGPKESKIDSKGYPTFSKWLESNPKRSIYNQRSFLYIHEEDGSKGELIDDLKILRFENLKEDFESFMKSIGHSCKLLEKNTRSHYMHYFGEYDFRDYYDDKSVSLLKEIAHEDINHFGFKYGR